MDSSLRALHKNIAEWMAGPTGAVILHLVLILALLFLVDFSGEAPPDDPIEVTVLSPQEVPPLEVPPPEILNPLDQAKVDPKWEPPPIDIEPPPVIEARDFARDDLMNRTPDLAIAPAISPLVFQNLVSGSSKGRIGEQARSQSGRLYGDKWFTYTEAAVKRALEWLRINQNPDGSWGTADHAAMTGLAILTFLAHGETTVSESYGETVTRAIRYLKAQQNEAGEFARIDTTAGTYSQAICVYAISEAFGMTRIQSLREVMEKGVEVLIRGQQASGGFDYRFEQRARRDTSLSGWCSQALKAAFIAGAENPRLKTAMDLAVADMKAAQKADGSFVYSDAGSHSTHGITAVAVLSMQLLGHDQDREVKKGLSALGDADCNWKHPPAWPMYAWYYISQTKFHQGGGSWKKWNNEFAPQFIRSQNPDGSWDSAGLNLKKGAHGREQMHPVYATTLAALTLQVYYRNLPTFKPIEEQTVQESENTDVTIQIL